MPTIRIGNHVISARVIATILLIVSTYGAVALYLSWVNNSPDFGWKPQEEIEFTYYAWGPNNAFFDVMVQNTSPDSIPDLSITQVQVNGAPQTSGLTFSPAGTLPYLLTKGSSVTITITKNFTIGAGYTFVVVTAKGYGFGLPTLTAP